MVEMVRMRLQSFVLLVAFTMARADGADYVIRPAPNDRLALEVEKTGVMRGKKHLFLFERYRGTLKYDSAAPEKSQVRLVIESASAVLKDQWLSSNDFQKVTEFTLKDMLAAEKYREIEFVSTRITAKPASHFDVEGSLTIRGIAKPVTVPVTMRPDGDSLVFEGAAKVKMSAYGLKPPSAAMGMVGTRDEMTVSFSLRANVEAH